MSKNRQWILKERPAAIVGPEHFELKEADIPTPGDGEILVKSLYFSMDPTQRGWLHDEGGYIEPVAIGDPMRAGGLAQVVESNNPEFAKGDVISGTFTWQDYMCLKQSPVHPLRKVDTSYPLSWNMSAFGTTTLTAYFGMLRVAELKEGDVVLVSGAAGATGSAAVQIAKIKGAKKVIGVAGGPEKCQWLIDELGCDAAIDYKSDDLAAKLKEYAPDGIDVFYDNTGGPILDAALGNMAQGCRIAVCGGISTGYASWVVDQGPKNYLYLILFSAKMQGFLVLHYIDEFPDAIKEIGGWVQDGSLKVAETVIEGFDKAPETLQGLFTGKNTGKMILKVADPE